MDKLKGKDTMTVGVTPSRIETGATLDLHGHPVKVTLTDAEETTIAYANGALRTLDTPALNAFLDLGTFPTGTKFSRPTASGSEQAWIQAVTGDCCYQVRIIDTREATSQPTFTYSELMDWHAAALAAAPEIKLPPGAHPYVPRVTGEQPDEAHTDEAQPVESDLAVRIRQLEAALAAMEVESQKRINTLTQENFTLKETLHTQKQAHATVIAGYDDDFKRLEAKAAIFNPPPTHQEFQVKLGCTESELTSMNRDGWQPHFMQFMPTGLLHVVFVRDLPASAAGDSPRVAAAVSVLREAAAAPAPVGIPPMPVNQTVVGVGQPISRALTNNQPKPGDTRRIPTLQEFRDRQAEEKAAIANILQRGADEQIALRQRFAQQPSPFRTPTGASS